MSTVTPITNDAPIQSITVVRGTEFAPTLTVVSVSLTQPTTTSPYNLTGCVVSFIVKNMGAPLTQAPLFTLDNATNGGIVVTNATAGTATITIPASTLSSTTEFPDNISREYGIVVSQSGQSQLVLRGPFVVITRATA